MKFLFLLCFASTAFSQAQKTPLFKLKQAVIHHHYKEIDSLLRKKVDFNGPHWNGESLIVYVAQYDKVAMAKVILKFNPKHKSQALLAAAERNHFKMADLLLRSGANPNTEDELGRTPLYFAAFNSDSELYTILEGKGAKPRLLHQLMLCPAREFSRPQKSLLGDFLKYCLCPEGRNLVKKVDSETREFTLGCESPPPATGIRATKEGLWVSGKGQDIKGRIHPTHITRADFYVDGQQKKLWTCQNNRCRYDKKLLKLLNDIY